MQTTASTTRSYRVLGMDCAEEVSALRKELGPIAGIADLRFDLLSGRMTVEGQDINPQTILSAVAAAGLEAQPWREDKPSEDGAAARRRRAAMTALSGLLTLAGFLVHAWLHGSFLHALAGGDASFPLPSKILYAAGAVFGGWFVFPKALAAARRLRPDMNLLMTIAVIGAIAISEWFEAAAVSFLFSLSLLLEAWSVGRARRAIEKLMDLTPPVARLFDEESGESVEKPVEEVPLGTIIQVRPAEKIPLDGVVTSGTTIVDQSPITGESLPVEKTVGEEVFAGTVNGDGAILFRSTKPASDTTLARIIAMVEEARSRRSQAEQWVEKFARYYTPVMLAVAIAVALLPPLLSSGSFDHWLYQALVILVIACPCALVISTPVSMVAGLASAAGSGILIKGGRFLEIPAKLRALALDKTGTLTYGSPEVEKVIAWNDHDEETILRLAASLESASGHPIAKAILRAAAERGIQGSVPAGLRDIKGKGSEACIEGKDYWIGSHRFMHEKGAETDEVHRAATAIEDDAHTLVALGTTSHVCGLIAVSDRVREGAAPTVEAIRRAGVLDIVMLTGDNQKTARSVAARTGIQSVRADLLPADKLAVVEELVKQHRVVAMIGDGVNDAPAMTAATLGIAMGATGTDAAIETADIALMSDDLARIPWLIDHSRRVMRIIRQNIAFALAVKAVFMALALLQAATLWMAIAADMGASLLVVSNALRLLRTKTSASK